MCTIFFFAHAPPRYFFTRRKYVCVCVQALVREKDQDRFGRCSSGYGASARAVTVLQCAQRSVQCTPGLSRRNLPKNRRREMFGGVYERARLERSPSLIDFRFSTWRTYISRRAFNPICACAVIACVYFAMLYNQLYRLPGIVYIQA